MATSIAITNRYLSDRTRTARSRGERTRIAGHDRPVLSPPLPPGREVELPGRGVTWVREHNGPDGAPTVLLLHGWTATADLNWFTTYAALARSFRVVAMDHRGHGRGIQSRERFTLTDCADDAAALIDALDLGPVIPVGYSMGGPIAQLLWYRHRAKVDGLVLCATSGCFRTRPEERALFAGVNSLSRMARVAPMPMIGKVGQRLMTARLQAGPLHDWAVSELSRANPRTVIEAGAALGRYNSDDWLGDVDVPTAVVITDQDRVVPTDRQARMAAAIPGSTEHHVKGDHAVCVTDPDDFVPVLLQACQQASARASRRP